MQAHGCSRYECMRVYYSTLYRFGIVAERARSWRTLFIYNNEENAEAVTYLLDKLMFYTHVYTSMAFNFLVNKFISISYSAKYLGIKKAIA